MKLKTLMLTLFFGLLSATIMTGCGDKIDNNQGKIQDKVQENGHGHSH